MRTLNSMLLLAAALSWSACGGCGEPSPHLDTDVGVGADTDTSSEDDALVPPDRDLPGGVLLDVSPHNDVYPVGMRVVPTVTTYDAWGEPASFAWELTVEPADAVTPVDGRYELLREGVIRFTACTTDLGADDAPVCGWDEVIVNAAPPKIEIFTPQGGAMLDSTADPSIEVTGRVTDTFGEPQAFINGVALALDADGNFTAEVTPRFGINHIEVSATDGLHPQTSTLAVDVMWAHDYQPQGDPPVAFDEAVALRLGQLFIDDRVPVVTGADGTRMTHDLADIMSLVIQHFDLTDQIPNPVIDESSFTLSVPSVAIGKPDLQIDIVDGGLELFVRIPQILATTEGAFVFDGTTLSLDGSLMAGMSALILISVEKLPGEDVNVVVDSLSVAIESATPQFASPEANAIFALASSVLRRTLEEMLIDALEGSFINEIPALLANVFTTLDETLSGIEVPIDTGLGAPVDLSIDGGLRGIDAVYREHITAMLQLEANTSVTNTYPDARGVPLLFPVAEQPFFQQSRVQFGVRFALVNAILSGLWQSGLLEADVTDQVPLVSSAILSAKLPPVMRPPSDGEPHDLVIELGQVEVSVELQGQTDVFGVNISAGVDFGISQGAIGLGVGATPRIHTWLIDTTGETSRLSPTALRSLIETGLWPQLMDAVASGLEIPLPAPDLSGLGDIAEPLAGLTLEYLQTRELAIRSGWIVLDATMQGTLPP